MSDKVKGRDRVWVIEIEGRLGWEPWRVHRKYGHARDEIKRYVGKRRIRAYYPATDMAESECIGCERNTKPASAGEGER
jgi:hypothetical protein